MQASTWIAAGALLVSSVAVGDDREAVLELLRRVNDARQRFQTAEVHYHQADAGKPDHQNPIYFTWRWANGDCWWSHRGTEDGALGAHLDGTPAKMDCVEFLASRVVRDISWIKTSRANMVEANASASRKPFDLRSAGLTPRLGNQSPEQTLIDFSRYPRVAFRDHGSEAGRRVVAVELGELERTYWIDPERGYSVTRVVVKHNGDVFSTTEIDNQECDGIWFPREVKTWRGADTTAEPWQKITVDRVTFDRPAHAQAFGVEVLGIDEDTEVTLVDSSGRRDLGHWDSQNQEIVLVSDPFKYPQFMARRAAEQQKLDGPAAQHEIDRLRKLAEQSRYPTISQWKQHTLDFCARYNLNDEQREKALTICAGCEARASELFAKRGEAIQAAVAREQEALAAFQQNRDAGALRRAQRSAEQRIHLTKDISLIFYDDLVPRLDGLVTRAQRAAVDNAGAQEKDGE